MNNDGRALLLVAAIAIAIPMTMTMMLIMIFHEIGPLDFGVVRLYVGVCVAVSLCVCVRFWFVRTIKRQKCANNWLKIGRLVFSIIILGFQYDTRKWRRLIYG